MTTETTTDQTAPEMTTDWAAVHVDPGTPYADEPSQMVQPGWYVLGASEDEGSDVVIYVEEALDVHGASDIREHVANLIAERLRGADREQLYGVALKETAEIIGYTGIPELIPDKVRELVERLRTEITAVRANFAFERRVADVNDKEWLAADDECTQLRAELIERTHERDAARAQAKGFSEIATTTTEQHDGLKSEVERLTAENADLRRDLAKAERHDADVRLDAETDVRAELAAKAGA